MIIILPFLCSAAVKNYAVIMCGSKGWSNYRHQADLYAWRKVLINRGFNPANIITLSHDDIPTQRMDLNGTIYHTCEGPNLYEPHLVNYTGPDASKANFFKVLGGIPSGKGGFFKDIVNVLVIYINHGAYDILSTPNAFDQPIYTDEFGDAIRLLASRVSRVFCILEACYSGTIAMHTRYPRNVIFMTAANAKQSSYSYGYCELRCGPEGSTCQRLDVFTTNEMTYHVLNYLDNKDNDKRTINDLMDYTKHNTNLSSVVRSGLSNRLTIKELFKTIGKHGTDHVLGNVAVNNTRKRRNVNSLSNEELIRIYNRVHRTIVANADTVSHDRIEENRCRKRVSASALQLFVNDYLHEDNIEFLNMMGDLCMNYCYRDISEVMFSVRDSINRDAYYATAPRRYKRNAKGA